MSRAAVRLKVVVLLNLVAKVVAKRRARTFRDKVKAAVPEQVEISILGSIVVVVRARLQPRVLLVQRPAPRLKAADSINIRERIKDDAKAVREQQVRLMLPAVLALGELRKPVAGATRDIPDSHPGKNVADKEPGPPIPVQLRKAPAELKRITARPLIRDKREAVGEKVSGAVINKTRTLIRLEAVNKRRRKEQKVRADKQLAEEVAEGAEVGRGVDVSNRSSSSNSNKYRKGKGRGRLKRLRKAAAVAMERVGAAVRAKENGVNNTQRSKAVVRDKAAAAAVRDISTNSNFSNNSCNNNSSSECNNSRRSNSSISSNSINNTNRAVVAEVAVSAAAQPQLHLRGKGVL